MPVTTTTTTTSVDALRARGVAVHVAERLARCATPDLIGAWCSYAARQPVGPGLVVNGIRSGHPPPTLTGLRPRGEREPGSAEEVAAWLKAELPEVCSPEPHPAAVICVQRLHFRCGRAQVSARVHGAVIRAAVKAAERDASGEGRGERGEDA